MESRINLNMVRKKERQKNAALINKIHFFLYSSMTLSHDVP